MMFDGGLMAYWITIVLGALVIFLLWIYMKSRRAQNWPPGPPTLPFVGNLNLLMLDMVDMVKEFRKIRQQYGDVFSLVLGSQTVVVINGLETLREIFIKHGEITSCRGNSVMISDVCQYIGIAGSSGSLWKEHQTFAFSVLRDLGFGKRKMETRMHEEVQKLTELIHNSQGQSFDIAPLLLTSICNILCCAVFGKTFDYDDAHINELISCAADTESTEEIVGILTFLPFLKYIPGDPLKYHRVMQNEARIYSFLQSMIDEHKETVDHGDVYNYLDAYLRQQKKEIGQNSTFTDKQLLRCLADFFVAGIDPPAIALRWFLLVLLYKPDIQESMFEEIKKEVGDSRYPSITDRKNLAYCDSVLHEVFRFGNMVPLSVPHGLTEDLQFHGYFIPKHAMLIPNLDSVMNDPDLFENPTEFIPTRFLSKDGGLTGTDKVPAFGIGRRICIGEPLARMEFFIIATTLVQRFKFLPPDDSDLPSLSECKMGEARSPLSYKLKAVQRD